MINNHAVWCCKSTKEAFVDLRYSSAKYIKARKMHPYKALKVDIFRKSESREQRSLNFHPRGAEGVWIKVSCLISSIIDYKQ